MKWKVLTTFGEVAVDAVRVVRDPQSASITFYDENDEPVAGFVGAAGYWKDEE